MKGYLKTKNGILYHGDCLGVMNYLSEKNIKFNLILTDPPYGITSCKLDSVIPLDKMWNEINKIIYDNTPIALFGSEPFSSKLRLSNLKNFKYDWIWKKNTATGGIISKYMPLKNFEIISIYCKKTSSYYPIKQKRIHNGIEVNVENYTVNQKTGYKNHINGLKPICKKVYGNLVNPKMIIEFKSVNNSSGLKLHPTQKPVPLYEYLIKTYTKENDLILDFCAGSGTLAIACHNLNRRFIMVEKELKYCELIKQRLLDNNVKLLKNRITNNIKLRKR